MSCLLSQAMTVNELLSKYKSYPNAQYKEVKGKELKKLRDNVSSETEKEILRTAKKLVIVLAFMEDDEFENLTSDLNTLEDYSQALYYTLDDSQSEEEMPNNILGIELVTSASVGVYSEQSSSSEYLLKPVFAINLCGMIGVIYIDGKIKSGDEKEIIKLTT